VYADFESSVLTVSWSCCRYRACLRHSAYAYALINYLCQL